MMISLHLVVGLAERGVACIFRIQKLLLENAKKGHKVYYYCWDSTAIVQAYQFALHKL